MFLLIKLKFKRKNRYKADKKKYTDENVILDNDNF